MLGSLMASPSRELLQRQGSALLVQRHGGNIQEDDATTLSAQGCPVTRSHQTDHCDMREAEQASGTVKVQAPRQLEAEGSLPVGAAIVVDDLPKMEVAVIQQGQEVALAGLEVHLGDGGHVSVQARELHTRGHHRS